VAAGSLAVRSVVVAFGGLRALDGVGVDFAGDAITGLIGPNGSGKSTLVNTMSGQITPRSGTIGFGGTDITGRRADRIVRLGLARTYQIPRMPPQLTVADVLAVPLRYGRRVHRAPGLDSPGAVAEFCGLVPLLHRHCAGLSVTDLRRLEIARALACGPSMLLLDEVMAGLSHADSLDVMAVIRRVHAAGIGIVIIEHLMRVITALCHRVVVLNNGSLLAAGMPGDVLADPAVREAYLGKGFKH
jgi:branched-chain amino acid transport system ATP-binding protein